MGKYERDWSDLAESSFANSINGQVLYKSNFDRGDVEKDGIIYEVKAGKSLGTLANIGQNFLTEVSENFKGVNWQQFRLITSSDEKKLEYVKQFYPTITSWTEFIENHSEVFRNTEKVHFIEEIAKQDKLAFLRYLAKSEQKNQKQFYINAINGCLKTKKYVKNPIVDDKYKVVKVDKDGSLIGEIKYFFDDNVEYVFTFFGEKTCFQLCYIQQKVGKVEQKTIPLLNLALHWKNKFQGGATPCVNVFYVGPVNIVPLN
jgi:hypothetical protein